MTSLAAELDLMKTTLRGLTEAYIARLETELTEVQARLAKSDLSKSRLMDVRDMLTLVRHLDVKPEKGRRKDFKKIETVVEDLRMLTEKWS